MPKDYAIKHNTTFTGYTGLQAGQWNNITTIGIIAGGTLQKNQNYLNAEIGLGSSANASVKAGHEFDIGKNMGLELSAGAKSGYSFVDTNSVSTKASVTCNDASGNISFESSQNRYSLQANLGTQMKFNLGKKVRLGVGLEGGVRHDNGNVSLSTKNDIELNVNDNNYVVATGLQNAKTAYLEQSVSMKSSTHAYITPTFSAQANFGKIQINADAQICSGQVNVAYKF